MADAVKVLSINRTPSDFVRDTQHLTTEEVGAYQMICDYLVIRGQDVDPPSLPDDDDILASLTRLPRARWRKIKPRLCSGPLAVLIASGGRISQLRTALEIEAARGRIVAGGIGGRASGEARRKKADMRERLTNGRSTVVHIDREEQSNDSGTSHESRVTSHESSEEERERIATSARTRALRVSSPKRLDWLVEQVRKFENLAERTGLCGEDYDREFLLTIGYTPAEWERVREDAFAETA